MNAVQKAIFPGVLLGILALVFLSRLAGATEIAQAAPLSAAEQTALSADEVVLTPEPAPTETKAAKTKTAKARKTPPPEETSDEDDRDSARDSDCSLGGSYPENIRQWCGLIEKHAADNGLDPRLIAAVMLQESGGNAQAYSSSGAVGLLQVMPRDGIAASFMCANGPCFASRPSMDELYDPDFNIQYGSRMLAGLVNKNGSVRDALMAYGPMNVGYYYADKVLAIYERYQ